jgi:hypothetical protein
MVQNKTHPEVESSGSVEQKDTAPLPEDIHEAPKNDLLPEIATYMNATGEMYAPLASCPDMHIHVTLGATQDIFDPMSSVIHEGDIAVAEQARVHTEEGDAPTAVEVAQDREKNSSTDAKKASVFARVIRQFLQEVGQHKFFVILGGIDGSRLGPEGQDIVQAQGKRTFLVPPGSKDMFMGIFRSVRDSALPSDDETLSELHSSLANPFTHLGEGQGFCMTFTYVKENGEQVTQPLYFLYGLPKNQQQDVMPKEA